MANEKSLGNGNNENHQAEHTKQLKETCCKNDNRTLRENGYNLSGIRKWLPRSNS